MYVAKTFIPQIKGYCTDYRILMGYMQTNNAFIKIYTYIAKCAYKRFHNYIRSYVAKF